MTKIFLTTLAAVLLLSCGGNENSKEAKNEAKRQKTITILKEKYQRMVVLSDSISKEMKVIDDSIRKLENTHSERIVTTMVAKDTVFKHYVELQANVQTKENLIMNAEFNGILRDLYVQEGQRVSKDEVLGKIDDGGLNQQLAQMEIQANMAKTTYEKQKNLWDQKIGSEIQFLQAKTNYEAQSTAVLQLKSQIAKTLIKAPFSGNIDELIAKKGSVVSMGMPILRIVNLDNMYLEAEVPEKLIKSINRGTEAVVVFPMLNETINTNVSAVNNFINPENRSFKIQVKVPNKDKMIKPNLSGKLSLNDYKNPKVIAIPVSVLLENADGGQYVFCAKDITPENTAVVEMKIVKTGKTQGEHIEILEGINNGDIIIIEGARSLKEGQNIFISKN